MRRRRLLVAIVVACAVFTVFHGVGTFTARAQSSGDGPAIATLADSSPATPALTQFAAGQNQPREISEKQGEPKSDAKSGDARHGDIKHGDTKSGDSRVSETRNHDIRPTEPRTGDLPRKSDDGASTPADPASLAEKVARLRKSLESDQRRLGELQSSVQDTMGNFAKSEEEFRRCDAQLEEYRKQLAIAAKQRDGEEQTRLEALIKEGLEQRAMAKQRFETAINERRAAQEAIKNLEQKTRVEQEAIDKLLGQAPPASATASPPVPPANGASGSAPAPLASTSAAPATPTSPSTIPVPPPPPPTTVADILQSVTGQKLANGASGVPVAPASAPQTQASAGSPGASSIAPASIQASPAAPLTTNAGVPRKLSDKVLQEAAAVARQTAAEAQAAEQEARTITERAELLKKNIEVERRLRDAARQRVDEADLRVQQLADEVQRALVEGRDAAEAVDRLQDVEEERREARHESWRTSTHLDELQTEFSRLQDEQIAALEDAQLKRDAADAALRRVATLNNPLSLRNILQWLIEHGPRVVAILLAMAGTLWLSRALGRRLIGFMVLRGLQGTPDERENRAHTLVGVLHNAINVGTIAAGMVTILDEIGVPVGPVMGGAAVFGLAVAFGAQSLIKDYFTGFMLLVEQQYLVNDVVKIGETTGQVERISLRMTMLRDGDGNAHFIPHGQITTVTNLTHTWSRAVFDISIAYGEDIDRVLAELESLARGMIEDPEFADLVLEEPMMLGVDKLAESGVVIKFFLKTRPLQQWPVKRELLRRIKNRFDELGIEIPTPQRTVHLRRGVTALQPKRNAA
ncbi:MAG TPA: mechanosensitive ion channel [Pirellulaceae bacterium]|nr:mechanosensitive ion channel [Pirellulaceae bacterium]